MWVGSTWCAVGALPTTWGPHVTNPMATTLRGWLCRQGLECAVTSTYIWRFSLLFLGQLVLWFVLCCWGQHVSRTALFANVWGSFANNAILLAFLPSQRRCLQLTWVSTAVMSRQWCEIASWLSMRALKINNCWAAHTCCVPLSLHDCLTTCCCWYADCFLFQ